MVSSARRTVTCILLVLGTAFGVSAQTTPQKVGNATISGKVTVKGKPAVGVMVLAKDSTDYGGMGFRFRARTDQTGSYRLTNLPAGTYELSTNTPALVVTNQSGSVVVSEAEEVNDINLQLVPGGVITGKITDSEGEPLIGQPVRVTPAYDKMKGEWGSRNTLMRLHIGNMTDDRGVYRVFGLPPGKYRVSVGESGSGRKGQREYYKETFFPSVSESAKATIIEVTEGSETNDVDIVMGRPVRSFNVAGRVVDEESGKPVPNLKYGVGQKTVHDEFSSSSSSSVGNEVTNANGEFRLENITPGTYTIFTVAPEGSDLLTASVTFEVVDRDLTNLLIKTTKGSSLSGVVVIDGNQRSLTGLRVSAWVESKHSAFANSPSGAVSQDGTFRIDGVRSGTARLRLFWQGERHRFEIVRVERNGIPQETIDVKEREHVAGLRVSIKHMKLTGAIRGQVKVENGELPPPSQLWFMLWPLDENLEPQRTSSLSSPQLDARGHFLAEGLPAGTYRLSVSVVNSAGPKLMEAVQQVTVTDDTVTEVTLTLKPQPNPKLQ